MSPVETPARHSELAALPTASLMTSAACKTPGSGAEAQEERRERREREGQKQERSRGRQRANDGTFSIVF